MEAPRKSKSSSKSKKESGIRTKFLIESLRKDYYALREENERLRTMVSDNLPGPAARAVLAECFDPNAPRAKLDDLDDLAGKMAGSNVDDDDEDD